jgi:hypothetical protein
MNKKVKLTVSLLVIGSASVLAYLGYKKYFGVATQTDEPTSLPKETMQDRIEEKVVDKNPTSDGRNLVPNQNVDLGTSGRNTTTRFDINKASIKPSFTNVERAINTYNPNTLSFSDMEILRNATMGKQMNSEIRRVIDLIFSKGLVTLTSADGVKLRQIRSSSFIINPTDALTIKRVYDSLPKVNMYE